MRIVLSIIPHKSVTARNTKQHKHPRLVKVVRDRALFHSKDNAWGLSAHLARNTPRDSPTFGPGAKAQSWTNLTWPAVVGAGADATCRTRVKRLFCFNFCLQLERVFFFLILFSLFFLIPNLGTNVRQPGNWKKKKTGLEFALTCFAVGTRLLYRLISLP